MDIALKGYDHVTGLRRAPSLLVALATLHIPIISSSLAQEHRREMVAQSRIGIYQVFGPIFYAVSSFLDLITRSDRRFGLFVLFMVALIGVSASIATTLPFLGMNNAYFVAATIVSVIAVVALFIYGGAVFLAATPYSPLSPEFGLATTIWERHTVNPLDPASLNLYAVPEHLHGRMRRAAAIDGAKVHIERFRFDPLVVVTRRRLFYTETAYIGGWDTGKADIDNA